MIIQNLIRKVLTLIITLFLSFPLISIFTEYASSHSGRTDSYGCHHNRKQGGYHCHSGPLAGQSFSSKTEMLQKLMELQKPETDNAGEEPTKNSGQN